MLKNLPLSYIEISKNNLIHNIKQFKNLLRLNHFDKNGRPTRKASLGKDTKIAAVIKANAYGHGDREVAKILAPYVDYFQVDSIEEAERVRSATKKPILVFGYLNEDGINRAIKIDAIISGFDLLHVLQINYISGLLKKKIKIHVPIDSFLGREGIMPNQVENFIIEIKKMKNVELDGVYSHFANIEDTMNRTHAEKQIEVYHKCVEIFKKNGYPNIKTHISATSGILVYETLLPSSRLQNGQEGNNFHNIVRLGIGLYGLWPSDHLEYLNRKKITLKPILRWVTHIAQVKVLPPNHPIGYGLTHITKKSTKIAIVPQGYADGLNRSLSNNGEFIIKGKKVKILGRVAMNMTVVDVSNIKDVMAGDEVVIIGEQMGSKITTEQIAVKMNSINYEVVTKLNPFLPRIIV